jgi:hypothetical protein
VPELQEVIGLPKRERLLRSRMEFTASKSQQILANRAANSTSAKAMKTFGGRRALLFYRFMAMN